MEKFVVEWLMWFIGGKLNPKQFGGLKGNSISHYMIELLNYILYTQDYNLPVAVLICAVNFSKAFNCQSHNILVTKLSDMGVPGWLLNVVMGFLTDRVMVVRYKGEITESKSLPGGGPQGTLLGSSQYWRTDNQSKEEIQPIYFTCQVCGRSYYSRVFQHPRVCS